MHSITSIRVIDVLEIAGYSHFMNTWYYVCDWLYIKPTDKNISL